MCSNPCHLVHLESPPKLEDHTDLFCQRLRKKPVVSRWCQLVVCSNGNNSVIKLDSQGFEA